MLFIDWKDEASAEDLTRWQEQCDALREIEIRARDKGDPWLFHGANAGNAADIIACGPESQVRVISEDGISYMQGIYFGTLATAAVFATGLYRRSPAIIAVRASDLASAFQIFPDSNIVECGTCREDLVGPRRSRVSRHHRRRRHSDVVGGVVEHPWDSGLGRRLAAEIRSAVAARRRPGLVPARKG